MTLSAISASGVPNLFHPDAPVHLVITSYLYEMKLNMPDFSLTNSSGRLNEEQLLEVLPF